MLRLCSRCHIICLYSGPLTYWKINFCCWSKAVCLHSIDWLPVAAAVLGGDGSAEVAEETKTGLWRVAIRQSASTGPGIVHSGGLTQPSRSSPQAGGRHACKRECTRKMQREERRGIKNTMFSLKHGRRGSLLWDLLFCYYPFVSETPLLTLTHADITGDPGLQNALFTGKVDHQGQ